MRKSWNLEQLKAELARELKSKYRSPHDKALFKRWLEMLHGGEQDLEDIAHEYLAMGARNPSFDGDFVGYPDDDFGD